jgi:P2 family phage major capsid protein
MRNATRVLFNAYVSQVALLSGIAAEDAAKGFSVAPVVEQRLEEIIFSGSEFLQQIAFVPVDQQEGDKVGLGITRPLAGRTNTNINPRRPTDPTDTSDLGRYRCEKTNFDHALKYAKLDAWSHKPQFQQLIRDVILKQQGRDRIMIGWNGRSVAAQTDLAANPLLQDVNKGWLYKIETHAPERVLDDGELTTGAQAATKAIYVGDGEVGVEVDYANIDALAFDAIELMDEWHRDDTDLVVIVGRDLVHEKYLNVINAAGDKATEMEARDRILTLPKQVGGKRAVMVPSFPKDAMLITSLDNLAIYVQNETRRRVLREEPEWDQVANYESVNEAYVVEEYGRTALVKNIRMGRKPA